METLRGLFGKLINAQPDDIAIINSTSYGVAVMANNISVESSQEIVIITDQFPSNVLENIGANTAIAALPPCHRSDGTGLDLITIGAKCRKVGAALCVGATQTVGSMVMDMTKIRPDFMVASAYKWLLCAYTLAFLYVAPHRQNSEPFEQHR